MLSSNIVVLPNELEVHFVGCDHERKLPADVVVPALVTNRMLFCPACPGDRQWRLSYEEPSERHGSPFRPGQRATSAT